MDELKPGSTQKMEWVGGGGGGSAPLAPLAPTGLSWHSKWKGIVVTTMNNAAKKFTPKKRQKHLEIRH